MAYDIYDKKDPKGSLDRIRNKCGEFCAKRVSKKPNRPKRVEVKFTLKE